MSRLVAINVDEEDYVTFCFDDDPNLPFILSEFDAGTQQHKLLSALESRIREYNSKYKPPKLNVGAMSTEDIEALMGKMRGARRADNT